MSVRPRGVSKARCKTAAKLFGLAWVIFSMPVFGEEAVDSGENIEEVVVTAKRITFLFYQTRLQIVLLDWT